MLIHIARNPTTEKSTPHNFYTPLYIPKSTHPNVLPHALSLLIQRLVDLHHNTVLLQPVLLQRLRGNALHPIVARYYDCASIKKQMINVLTYGALAQHDDVAVGLEDGFVVMNALTGYLVEKNGFVSVPFVITEAGLVDALTRHHQGVG